MKYTFDGYNWIVRLEKGEQLIASLIELIKKEDIKGAWISGLGGALNAELGFYELSAKEYHWKTIDKLMEITSLQGNISQVDDEAMIHLHATLSDESMQAYGGHVKELTVGGTCELLLHTIQSPLARTHNEEIGLTLLDL